MGVKKNWQLPWILPIQICMLEIGTESLTEARRPTELHPAGWFQGQTGSSDKDTAIGGITPMVCMSPSRDVSSGSSL